MVHKVALCRAAPHVGTQVLAASLPIQLPVNGLGKAVRDGPSDWAAATCVGYLEQAPGFWLWPSAGCYSHLGRELPHGRSLSAPLTFK